MTQKADLSLFRRKVWTVAGIAALSVVLLLIVLKAINVLLLIFLAALIAILLRGTSSWVERKTGMKRWLAMTVTIGFALAVLTGTFWFIGAKLQSQITTLSDQLPQLVKQAQAKASETPIGKRIVGNIGQPSGQSGKLMQTARGFLRSTFGVGGDLYVVFLLLLFFTATPTLYVNGLVKLMPAAERARTKSLLRQIGAVLYKWFAGKLFSMAVVAVLTGIGLSIIGVPLALTLALIAGILAFVPNFGPVVAMAIGVLVALLDGTQTALLVAGLYALVQFLESNIITPVIQKKMVAIPPALIIAGQLVVGLFTGAIGLVVATPLVVMLMTVVQELWTKPQDTAVPVQHTAKQPT